MSLVNDMLRELEERRAPEAGQGLLAGMQPVDSTPPVRRRSWLWLLVPAVLVPAVLWRLGWLPAAAPAVVPPGVPATTAPAAVTAPPAPPAAAVTPSPAPVAATSSPVPAGEPPLQLLALLPQSDESRLVLQLLFDRAPQYRRSEQPGMVSLQLPPMQLGSSSPLEGRLERQGRTLAWSLRPLGEGTELLLAGLGEQLQVRERLQQTGDRWQLWVEVPLDRLLSEVVSLPASAAIALPVPSAPASVPVSAPPTAAPAASPTSAPVIPAAQRAAAAASVRPAAAVAVTQRQLPAAQPAPLPKAAAGEVKIAPHPVSTLEQARSALQAGRLDEARSLLETLRSQQPDNPEVLRWLARVWLAGGQGARLLGELPGWVERFPQDGELRMLLARARLQHGDAAGAVTLLEGQLPAVARDPASHALLAAALQQIGRWHDSGRIYHDLVALRPAEATWQLGLAIALEQQGRRGEALARYRQSLPGLDAASRRYVTERMQVLGGEP